ncbi:hypothetical protein [Myxosarcina sp. GI1]|uniref:hypothetical protein n=1 Tax=Myxosarcina sp. GI1 TaxID=1541065 RepID=UPI0012E0BD92|nr:hypothetical protein [Myxosarcina sp. GI1]
MTISFQTQTSRTKKPYSKQFLSSFRIEEKDLIFVVGGIGMAIYLAVTDLALLVTILASFAVAGSLYFISACLPLVSKKLNFRISIWHLLTVVCGLTLAFSAWQPSHALFLTGLEEAIDGLVASGGVGSISTAQIDTLFTFIRIALILVGLGGGFAAWQQQQQGQSMTPIIMFVGGLFGIVLAIDIMTAVIATGT